MSAHASGYQAPGGWSWPGDLPSELHARSSHDANDSSSKPSSHEQDPAQPQQEPSSPKDSSNDHSRQRTYKPRTCRICLEVVSPTTQAPAEEIPSMFAGRPQVVYESPVGDGGRLISPCRCKGSQKYVHEECLQGWRHADPGYGRRNYWQCPTCKYKYRLQRMTWGRYISSTFAQLLLTVGIFWVAVFLLGFVADPIINLYVDPVTTLSNPKAYAFEESIILDNEPTWAEHMVKGFASLGLLGFVKVVITMSPFHWLNLRGTGFLRGRNGGRDRMNNISWVVVLLGIFTFLYAVFKGISAWSKRVLKDAGERVMDVGTGDDDDDE